MSFAGLCFLLPESCVQQLAAVNGGGGKRKMRAVYAYDPAMDSPNDNPDDELAIQQGDLVTVFGTPDGDGYYEVWLRSAIQTLTRT